MLRWLYYDRFDRRDKCFALLELFAGGGREVGNSGAER